MTDKEEPLKEPAEPHTCPFCGGKDQIFSKYRDGGSTLYHQTCPVSPDKSWPNPSYRFSRRGV